MGQSLTLLDNIYFILWKRPRNLAQTTVNKSFNVFFFFFFGYFKEDADCPAAAASKHILLNSFNMHPWAKLYPEI